MQPDKNWKFLRFFIIIFNFKKFSNISSDKIPPHSACKCLQFFLSIGSYSPEVGAFGTLIMSTKVFRLIICKNCDHAPRTILYLDI